MANREIVGDHLLFTFLTIFASTDVKPVHSKAIPVILGSDGECERWLTAPADEALGMQLPSPPGVLKIASRGPKEDEVQLKLAG